MTIPPAGDPRYTPEGIPLLTDKVVSAYFNAAFPHEPGEDTGQYLNVRNPVVEQFLRKGAHEEIFPVLHRMKMNVQVNRWYDHSGASVIYGSALLYDILLHHGRLEMQQPQCKKTAGGIVIATEESLQSYVHPMERSLLKVIPEHDQLLWKSLVRGIDEIVIGILSALPITAEPDKETIGEILDASFMSGAQVCFEALERQGEIYQLEDQLK